MRFSTAMRVLLLGCASLALHAESEVPVADSPWSLSLLAGSSTLTPAENGSGRGLQVTGEQSSGYGLKLGYEVIPDWVATVSVIEAGAAQISAAPPSTQVLGDLNYRFYSVAAEWFPWGHRREFSAYFDLGLHSSDNSVSNSEILYNNLAQNSPHFGVGALWRLSPNWGAVLDYTSFDNTAQLVSLGLQYQFGKPPPPPVYDQDQDRVPDADDQCPGTARGRVVNAFGCELDDDSDMVFNGDDNCPGTPMQVIVDARGCALDSDKDGVADGVDECPQSRMGVKVDRRGCELKLTP